MSRWAVLVISPQRIGPVELPTTKQLIVGRARGVGLELRDPGVDERHLSLRVIGDRPVLDPLGGTSGVRVNDVPCEAPLPLSIGDEIALGSSRLIVAQLGTPLVPPPRLASEDELTARLAEEVRRAGVRRPCAFLLVSTAGLNVAARQALTRRVVEAVAASGAIASWGEVAEDLIGAVIPELERAPLEALMAAMPDVAGPRASTAWARSPEDGAGADALIEAAFCRLLSMSMVPDEPTVADPFMVRLYALAEELVSPGNPLAVVGPRGSGRSTFAQATLRARGTTSPTLSDGVPPPKAHGAFVIRDVDHWTHEAVNELGAFARERRRTVIATSSDRAAFEAMGWSVVELPALSERPADVLALADSFLREARAALNRPRLALGSDAARLLEAYAWPGQVRELRGVILRAARAAVRDEVGSDALPSRLSAAGPRSNLRGALKDAERDLLLEALARTRWNVSAAAVRLGLPRRTVVYRMARLGLRRPSHRR